MLMNTQDFLGKVCFVSIDIWAFVCDGIGEDDLRGCTWWYGGEILLPGICMAFEPAEDTILVVSPS